MLLPPHSGGNRIEGPVRGSIGRASAMRSLMAVYGIGKGDGEVGNCESRGETSDGSSSQGAGS